MVLLIIAVSYLLTGFLCSKGITYMRQHNLIRYRHCQGINSPYEIEERGRNSVDHVGNEVARLSFVLAPIGVITLIYHWIVIDWDREERKLIRELKQDGAGRRSTHDQLRRAITEQNDARRQQLADELREMERKAEIPV